MLTRIYVDNYGCMVNFECHPEAQQLILGPNGAGKSTLFEVLALLRDFCVKGEPPVYQFPDYRSPDYRFVGKTRSIWQDLPEQTFELDVSGNGGDYRFRLIVDTWGGPEQPRVVLEEVTFGNRPIFRFQKGEVHLFNDRHDDKVQYPFDWHRSALATITERKDNSKLSWFKRWLGGLLVVSPDPRRMSGVAAQEAKHPDQYLSNFADWYRHLRQGMSTHNYLDDLRQVIEGIDDILLEEAGERHREIKVRMRTEEQYKKTGRDPHFSLSQLSDGQRVLIGLYSILHFAVKPEVTLCFDEPDNFIALREVQPWLTKVLDRAEEDDGPGAQIFVISHHPELLNRMAFKSGLAFDRLNGRHTRVKRFEDPLETGLTAAELIARGWDRE